jgi:peptidoglycan/LPS O-acetylase OafA/YrhL
VPSRERRRAERRKRKERSAERVRSRYAESSARDEVAREALEPLEEEERPGVVTVGAAFAALVALIFWVSAVVAVFTDTTVEGNEPSPLPLAAFAFLLSMMAWGMWKARYWAVLGFQVLLVLFLLAAVAGLVSATTLLQFVGTALLIALCGTLFYFMVKAMARIQMPTRLPRE